MPPETCPNCGSEVPRRAKACPECGADEETGWKDEAVVQRLGLPDDSFDYDEFVREEFGEKKASVKPRGIGWLWWIVGVLVLVAFALLLLRL